MAVLQPFRGIRPSRDKAHLVASRSVHLYKTRILNAKLEENPFTFLHVILPESGRKASTRPNTTERFRLVRQRFEEFMKKGVFIQDEEECLYLYRQVKDGHSYTGLIAGASVNDYLSGVIRIHEQTLTKREEVFKNYLDTCGFNAEPVLLSYPSQPEIEAVLARYTAQRSEYEFATTDGIGHYLWVIHDRSDIRILTESFARIPAVYIADGHHRSSSSALLALKKRAEKPEHTGHEMFNYCMAFFIAEDQLHIYDFNRVVKDLKGMSAEEFLTQLREKFEIEAFGTAQYRPRQRHEFGMYLEKAWYRLTPKTGLIDEAHPVKSLDAQILCDFILSPLLGIHDPKTDPRIGFISGPLGMDGLQRQVDEGRMKVAFALYPVSVDELKQVADAGEIMPPKTTWIEPKLRSGLVIQSLSE